ncbi:hypothetical protein [Sphingomonas cavernae]|uniref:hypothetical protein n=1 Tax=Sphingomonas cavernae TaxID=2320861 RepID=UPI0011C40B4E|nr:hypothetical protein [Sphingomonas cavernae]
MASNCIAHISGPRHASAWPGHAHGQSAKGWLRFKRASPSGHDSDFSGNGLSFFANADTIDAK